MNEHRGFRLDHFLQSQGVVGSGGQAKSLIQDGDVLVNGKAETRRRRQLKTGDVVRVAGQDYPYQESPASAAGD